MRKRVSGYNKSVVTKLCTRLGLHFDNISDDLINAFLIYDQSYRNKSTMTRDALTAIQTVDTNDILRTRKNYV